MGERFDGKRIEMLRRIKDAGIFNKRYNKRRTGENSRGVAWQHFSNL